VTRGYQDSLRWAEFYRVIEQAERSKERENRRLIAMGQMMSVEYLFEQMLAFVGIVVDIVAETIQDRTVLRQFVDRLNAVTPRPDAERGS